MYHLYTLQKHNFKIKETMTYQYHYENYYNKNLIFSDLIYFGSIIFKTWFFDKNMSQRFIQLINEVTRIIIKPIKNIWVRQKYV